MAHDKATDRPSCGCLSKFEIRLQIHPHQSSLTSISSTTVTIMGFFDFFKKQAKPQTASQPVNAPAAPLLWDSLAGYEIASCAGQNARQYLEALRIEGKQQGFTAILLGDADDASSLAENQEFQ